MVSHAGTVLLSELADRIGLTAALSEATDGLRQRQAGHDPGRVLVDVAVAIADGARTISDVQVLADQQGLHSPAGSVASTPTIWRVLAGIDAQMLAQIRLARAAARDRAWLARGELTGTELPGSRAAGRVLEQVVIGLDATLVTAHSDKPVAQQADPDPRGRRRLLPRPDQRTVHAGAGLLGRLPGHRRRARRDPHRPHARLAVGEHRRRRPAGARRRRGHHRPARPDPLDRQLPRHAGDRPPRAAAPRRDAGRLRDPRRLPLPRVHHQHRSRSERVPGSQAPGARRVEDRIRTGKDTGLGHLPSRHQQVNAVWTELALIAADLLALTQTMLLTDEPDLHRAEPKTLRYRLLHTAARITRGQRKVFLRLAQHWPWTLALARAFQRLRLIPLPA